MASTAPTRADPEGPRLAGDAATPARIGVRALAYLIDSGALLGFVLAFFALAGLILWIASDLGKEDAPDAAYYAFIGVFIGGTLIAWSVFNLVLCWWRGQSVGQYIVGLSVVDVAGERPSGSKFVLRWLALHPLLFHPLLIPVWALFSALTVSLTLSDIVLGLTLGLVALCILAPAVALVSAAIDQEHRALHDRATSTMIAVGRDNAA
jgi:hypothetical protein